MIFCQVDWLKYSVIDKIVKAMTALPLVLFDPSLSIKQLENRTIVPVSFTSL